MSSTIDGTAPLYNILAVLDKHEQLHHALHAAQDPNSYAAAGNSIDVQIRQVTIELGSERTTQLIHLTLEMARDALGWHTEPQLSPADQERVRHELIDFLHDFVGHERSVT